MWFTMLSCCLPARARGHVTNLSAQFMKRRSRAGLWGRLYEHVHTKCPSTVRTTVIAGVDVLERVRTTRQASDGSSLHGSGTLCLHFLWRPGLLCRTQQATESERWRGALKQVERPPEVFLFLGETCSNHPRRAPGQLSPRSPRRACSWGHLYCSPWFTPALPGYRPFCLML